MKNPLFGDFSFCEGGATIWETVAAGFENHLAIFCD